jgi:SAM-dependent methyltransferase
MGRVTSLRDYDDWHRHYDDPDSSLSWRLRRVQAQLRDALDRSPGPCRILSVCAGDGRDVIEVLRDRPDADRVSAVLVELHSAIAQRARDTAATAGLTRVEVRTTDAGRSEAYAGAVPAQVVLLVGIFGNIADDDLWRLLAFAPQLCAPGATLLWSRGLDGSDRNEQVRARLADAGFTELDYATSGGEDAAALGVVRYDGPPVALQPGPSLFTFRR